MTRRFFMDTEFMEHGGHVDLISIAVVSEQSGREYYAVSKEFDRSRLSTWVKTNVLPKLPPQAVWYSRAEIARDLLDVMQPTQADPVELWGWYSAFDHVALCSLYGSMVDLPPGMPWITHDVKQFADFAGCTTKPAKDHALHDALEDARWIRKVYEHVRDFNIERMKAEANFNFNNGFNAGNAFGRGRRP